MPICKYMPIVQDGPNGTTILPIATDPPAIELASLDGWHYTFVPDTATQPEQPAAVQWQVAVVDASLKDQIKAASRRCHLIAEEMQRSIRSVYSLDDEQYFARIGVGAALGAYVFQPGEQDALLAFGAHVESVRQWGRTERAKLGL